MISLKVFHIHALEMILCNIWTMFIKKNRKCL